MDETLEFAKGTFPSPILPNNIKNSKKFGIATAKAIYAATIEGTTGYYQQRNSMFKTNRMFANGKQPITTYLELMGVDKDNAFIQLDYHPRPIAPHFRDILVNTIMEKIERIECTGLSLDIKQRKADKKNDAAFRMKEGEFIQAINQEAGIEFEDMNAFTPESEEELELWSELNDKEREEILMEEGINFVLYNNDWISQKKEIAGDLVDTGLAGTQNYFDGVNRIRLKRIKSEYLFYGSTDGLDFRNVPYIGHMERMSIVDCRCLWPEVSEKEWYEVAKSNEGRNGNSVELFNWNYEWTDSYTRPYDGYLVDVMFFEYRVTKYINYVKGKDRNGRKVFDLKDGKPRDNENKKAFNQPLPTIYSGAWVVGTDILPKWGEAENLLRNNEDKEDVRFSYSIYMLNNDGTMMPLSPMGYLKSSIIQMDLAVLKIQQTLANTPPDGVEMDIDAVTEIDLGAGVGKVGPMKLREIRLQTGDRYYSGKDMAGDKMRPAMQDAKYSIGDKISQFINVYNWEFNNIRSYISINEATDGIGVDERKGLQVMNNQIKASNTATGHIYGGFINILNNTAKCIAIRLWDTLKQADANSMYMKLLGKENVDFIKRRKDITSSNYDVMIRVNQSPDDNMQLEANIERSLAGGQIELEDAVIVRDYAKTNPKRAVKYLSFIRKRRLKEMQEAENKKAEQAQTLQAQISQQQMAQSFQQQAELDKMELQKTEKKGAYERENIMQKLINDAILKNMETGAAIPKYVQILIDKQMAEMQEQELAKAEQEAIIEQQAEMEAMAMQEQAGEMPEEQMM